MRTRTTRGVRLAAVAFAGALLANACGGGESEERVVDYEGVRTVDELDAAGAPAGTLAESDAATATTLGEDDDPRQVLQRAIALTEVVTTGRFEVAEHLDGYGLIAEPTVLEGVFDADRELVGVRSDLAVALTPYLLPGMAVDDVGVEVEMIGDSGTTYVSGSGFGLLPGRWVRLEQDARLSDYADRLQTAARAVDSLQPLVEYVGPASLGGDETTWFEGDFEASALDSGQLAALGDVIWGMPIVTDGSATVEIDIHVGEDGLLRQVRWFVDGIDLNPLVGLWERGRFESTVAYRDLGDPVDIRVPGESEIVEESDLPPPSAPSPDTA